MWEARNEERDGRPDSGGRTMKGKSSTQVQGLEGGVVKRRSQERGGKGSNLKSSMLSNLCPFIKSCNSPHSVLMSGYPCSITPVQT